MSIFCSQADPPTVKNVGFMRAGARFSKNHGFGSKDALDGVLGLSWAHFGCSWGLLGGSFGAFAGFRWHLDISRLLFWRPCGLILPPEEPPTALRAPSERSRWPPEATKTPRKTSCSLLLWNLDGKMQRQMGAKTSGNFWHIILGHGHCGGVGAQRIEIII